jgi:hypothetical protein
MNTKGLTNCPTLLASVVGKGRKRIVWVNKPVFLVLFALDGGYIPPLLRWYVSGLEHAGGPAQAQQASLTNRVSNTGDIVSGNQRHLQPHNHRRPIRPSENLPSLPLPLANITTPSFQLLQPFSHPTPSGPFSRPRHLRDGGSRRPRLGPYRGCYPHLPVLQLARRPAGLGPDLPPCPRRLGCQ